MKKYINISTYFAFHSEWPQTWKTGSTGKYQGISKYWKYQGIIREI